MNIHTANFVLGIRARRHMSHSLTHMSRYLILQGVSGRGQSAKERSIVAPQQSDIASSLLFAKSGGLQV